MGEKGKYVPECRTKILTCLKAVHCSILKGFKEITSSCLSGSNLMNSCVRVKIFVEVRRDSLLIAL